MRLTSRIENDHDLLSDALSTSNPQAYVPPTSGTAANGKPVYSWDQAAAWLTRDSDGWNAHTGSPLTITYAFRSTAPLHMPEDTAGFHRFSAAQITATIEALKVWADAANITFTRVGSGTTGDTAYSNSATILFGDYTTGADDAAAFAYYPGSRAASSIDGDVWVNSSLPDNTPTFEDLGPRNILHEIGHALGLSHPGDYNGGTPTYAADAIYWQDSNMFTVMSYFGSAEAGADRSVFATGPQMHDIAAIQLLYGANMTTRTGNTTYGFHSNTGDASMTLTSNHDAAVFTIWDAGGRDTLNFSGYSTSSQIDLRPESFSSAGPGDAHPVALYNIGIARGVTIEDAIGGAGADDIVGNTVGNRLSGGGGSDHEQGGGGLDRLSGDAGADTLDGGVGADTLIGGAGVDILTGGAGADHFVFNVAPGALNADRVMDFAAGADHIDLDNAIYTALGAEGALGANAFHVGSAAADASDRVIYNAMNGVLFYDPDGTGAAAKVQIATLDAHLGLIASDFLVI